MLPGLRAGMQMELNVLGKSLPAMLTISDMQGSSKEG